MALSELYDATGTMAARVSQLDGQIQLLGTNATLVSARLGPEGRAMSELAVQLRDCAHELSAQISQIVRLATLQKMNASIFLVPPDESGQGIAAVRAMEELAATLGTALSAMTEMVAGDRHEPLQDSKQRLVKLLQSVRATDHADGGDMAPKMDCDPVLRFLDDVRPIYTMQAERDVHDALCPGARQAAPTEAADTVEDIFF